MLLHLHFKMGLHAVKVNLKIMLIISKERRAGGRDRGRKEGRKEGGGGREEDKVFKMEQAALWKCVSETLLPPPPPPPLSQPELPPALRHLEDSRAFPLSRGRSSPGGKDLSNALSSRPCHCESRGHLSDQPGSVEPGLQGGWGDSGTESSAVQWNSHGDGNAVQLCCPRRRPHVAPAPLKRGQGDPGFI